MSQKAQVTATEVLAQLHMAGLLQFFPTLYVGPSSVSGSVDLRVIDFLRKDDRFLSGILHRLHPEVGEDRVEFRSIRGTFGDGSLQIVIGRDTERFHADVDAFSPYDDLVGFGGHTGEVAGHFFARLWNRIFGRSA